MKCRGIEAYTEHILTIYSHNSTYIFFTMYQRRSINTIKTVYNKHLIRINVYYTPTLYGCIFDILQFICVSITNNSNLFKYIGYDPISFLSLPHPYTSII